MPIPAPVASTRQPKYFAAAGEPKTIWEVPAASHSHGFDAGPTEYEERVVSFFDHALMEPHDSSQRNTK